METTRLKDKVAVVTGAGGTLCSAMAIDLARNGAKVVLVGRTLAKLQEVEKQIKAEGGMALAVAADVANQAEVESAHNKVLESFGPCHILINGAGGNQAAATTTLNAFDEKELHAENPDFRGFFNLQMDKFLDVINVNTMGTVIPSFVFGKDMARNKEGNIINIASMNSYRPLTRVAAYGMAKAGIANFTQWLATYLAPANIRVNAIAPGFFLNDRSRRILLTPDEKGLTSRGENIMHHTPLKKFGEAQQLLGCMHWLIDNEAAAFVTGIVVPVDGGFLASSGV
ncbi:SDR family oxidoreductase [Catalinimonas sp. 4WD22]|uniref:SDR family oxidoreductase n=1 Tax=Catalinimonas locisalis TaxID=3133978 RepID=UPI0031018E7A